MFVAKQGSRCANSGRVIEIADCLDVQLFSCCRLVGQSGHFKQVAVGVDHFICQNEMITMIIVIIIIIII